MASDLILSLREVDVRFGKKQIFHNLDLNIHRGDLIALVGKNGIGKTTLMKIIEGSQDLDNGKFWQYPGLSVSEALYLDDPDKNGVELYWDKPQSMWPKDGNQNLTMYTKPLDLRSLLAEVEK